MKIRYGFVSNSSSTSYVIAIRQPTTPVEELIIQAVGIIANRDKTEFFETTAEMYLENLRHDKEELTKDIEFAGNHIDKLNNMLKDKKLTKVLRMAEDFREELDLHRSRVESDFKWTPQDEIDRLKINIERSAERLECINKKISKLDGIENDAKILSFSRDNWNSTDIQNALKLFDEHGKAIRVIEIDVG